MSAAARGVLGSVDPGCVLAAHEPSELQSKWREKKRVCVRERERKRENT